MSATKQQQVRRYLVAGLLMMSLIAAFAVVSWLRVLPLDDDRHLELIRGIATQGPLDAIPPPHGGAGFAYVMTPFYLIGGAGLVIPINVGFLVLAAWGCYFIGRRTGLSPMLAGAAGVLLLASRLTSHALVVSPYPLAVLLLTLAVFLILGARTSDSLKAACGAGFAGGLAIAAHAHCAVVVLVMVGLLVVERRRRLAVAVALVVLALLVPLSLLGVLAVDSLAPAVSASWRLEYLIPSLLLFAIASGIRGRWPQWSDALVAAGVAVAIVWMPASRATIYLVSRPVEALATGLFQGAPYLTAAFFLFRSASDRALARWLVWPLIAVGFVFSLRLGSTTGDFDTVLDSVWLAFPFFLVGALHVADEKLAVSPRWLLIALGVGAVVGAVTPSVRGISEASVVLAVASCVCCFVAQVGYTQTIGRLVFCVAIAVAGLLGIHDTRERIVALQLLHMRAESSKR